jgi:hypothetical protein
MPVIVDEFVYASFVRLDRPLRMGQPDTAIER